MRDVLSTGPITRELARYRRRSMTVSSSSGGSTAASPAIRSPAATTTTNTATTAAAITAVTSAIAGAQPALASALRNNNSNRTTASVKASDSIREQTQAQMRTFAVIICNDCLYLEFPGCDVHGVLYTERIALSDSSKDKDKAVGGNNRSRLHAKCPDCTAATNNVRPFRDGCRRCKGATTVYMWASTLDEIAQAHDAFPPHTEEIDHTALVCDSCQSVVFPRAREVLTRRSVTEPLATQHGKPLKVSNFQLRMPHVDGCARRGMPVTTVPIQLPKSELKFVHDRIDKCPLAPRIQGGLQYRARLVHTLTQQNHLHQIYLRLLTSVVKAFDAHSLTAIEPLQNVLAMFAKMEPLALFQDWSPPQRLSTVVVAPTRVLSSSDFDKDHGAHWILETGSSFWRSAPPTPNKPRDEWLSFQFSTGVTLSAITLSWHADFIPSQFALSVSADGTSFETVAIVVDGGCESRIALAKHQGQNVLSIKITFLSTTAINQTFGLQSIACHEAMYAHLFTPSDELLRNLQQWLLDASVSPSRDVRELALQALQQLALASGSLCGLLHLATGLLLNHSVSATTTARCIRLDAIEWNRIDVLSDTAQQSAGRFLCQLTRCIQSLVVDKVVATAIPDNVDSSAVLIDDRVLQGLAALLQDEPTSTSSTNDTRDNAQHPSAVHPFARSSIASLLQSLPQHLSLPPPPPPLASAASADTLPVEPPTATDRTDSESPFRMLSAMQPAFLQCITRRSQLGLILLTIVSELSAWQMKRMQRAEELAGKREEELMQLEEPFSIEVRPEFFDQSHRILSFVLAPWLPSDRNEDSNNSVHTGAATPEFLPHDDKIDSEQKTCNDDDDTSSRAVDLYTLLQQSFAEMRARIRDANVLNALPAQELEQVFAPDELCVALLQTITSNIRRLVLSRVDPSDVGIEPVCGNDDLTAPPALESIVSVLEQLISLGAKRSDRFFAVSLKAAAAVEVGMEAFYPSAHQRTQLLTSRMGKGATLEVQVRWPVQERDQEDPRYERLILMLQFECIRMGLTHAIRGSWRFFMHLIVQVPTAEHTERVLRHHFASCIQRAGFSSWQVVAGAQELSINLQRHLHWNRVEKMSHDSGAGWIRVYPRDVACYDDVLADVEHFLSVHDKRSSSP